MMAVGCTGNVGECSRLDVGIRTLFEEGRSRVSREVDLEHDAEEGAILHTHVGS
jgi:hypothetical protein